eukprot:scaffold418_cov386-Prasinococcus_capsulatus_cf.AAC.25
MSSATFTLSCTMVYLLSSTWTELVPLCARSRAFAGRTRTATVTLASRLTAPSRGALAPLGGAPILRLRMSESHARHNTGYSGGVHQKGPHTRGRRAGVTWRCLPCGRGDPGI